MKRFTLIILVLGICLAGAGFWYWQRNPYSKEILKLEIIGPEKASVLEEVEYTVKYKNNGNITLEEPSLIFEFPEYTLAPLSDDEEDQGEKIRRVEIGAEELGDIYPGEEKTLKFKGRLFGKEGSTKEAKAKMNFRPKNIKAGYNVDTTFTTVIDSVPLTFDFDLASKVESGREFNFSLNYFSNLNYPLTNLGVLVEYPSGFEFISSSPDSLGKDEWEIPLLNKADGGRIEIQGRLSGEFREQKVFTAKIGSWQGDEFIPLKEITRGVELAEPNLFIIQRINGSDNYIAKPGEMLHYEIYFRNISSEPFSDLFLVLRLDGRAFNFGTIKTDSGQFSSGDNSIVWDWRDVPKLRFLGQGEEGKVEFWINLEDWEISSPQEKNSLVKNSILISEVKEEFETKIGSRLVVSQQANYADEVFGNSGSNPPKAGERTTYTITWQAKNYYNDVKNAKVKAMLPLGVELTGKIFPESEASKFSFDSVSREIIWNIGNGQLFEAGAGVIGLIPNISFQVAITPLSDQRGKTVPLIHQARIMGEDQWTETISEGTSPSIQVNISN